MEVYLDESGYTGEDLINANQPIFVIASTTLASDLCREIFEECFRGLQAAELKHSSLQSRPSGREKIIRFIHAAKRHRHGFTTYVVHKEYALLTKLVDLWVEPAMHQAGIDFYNRGLNIAVSNLSYCILSSLLRKGSFQQNLTRFQLMMRARAPKSYDKFWRPLYKTYHHSNNPMVKDVLLFFLGAEAAFGFRHLLTLPERSLDLALSCALETVAHWHDKFEGYLTVVHDQSSVMAREKWLWDALVNPYVPTAEVGYDRRKRRYPLNVESTRFADSKHFLQLQFTDLLAGATAAYARSHIHPTVKSPYGEELKEAGIVEFVIGGMYPTTDVDPERLETVGENAADHLDFVVDLVRRAKRNG